MTEADLVKRVEQFLTELKALEEKHQFVIDHHEDFVSSLLDLDGRCVGQLYGESEFSFDPRYLRFAEKKNAS